MNLVEMLSKSVMKNGLKEALRWKQDGIYTSMTYDALWQNIMQFAHGLRTIGVKRGDKVGILSTNCPEWAITDFSVLALGAVVTPIYPTVPSNQVAFILQNADVTTVVVQNQEQLQKVLDCWPAHLQHAIVMHGPISVEDQRVLMFADVMQFGQGDAAEPISYSSIPDSALATIVHTSGTSGTPKGVMLSHRNIVSNVQAALSILPVEPSDISLSFLPLSHIFERTVGQFAALSSGATVAYAESIDTLDTNLKEVRPTILITVPRLLEKVYAKVLGKLEAAPAPIRKILTSGIHSGRTSGLTYRLVDGLVYKNLREGLGGRMRCVVSGGAGLAADIARFYIGAGIPVNEGYGMTEAAPVIAANPAGESRPGTVGRPLPGLELSLAPDGELLVKGPNVMMGYYNNPSATEETLTPDGWLRTGDIAEFVDGYVKIVDRKKNILVLATGKNIAPWPIENAISLSPYVSEAILVGDNKKYATCLIVPDFEALKPLAEEKHLGDAPASWVKSPDVRSLLAAEVHNAVADFAEFEQPKRIGLIPEPLTLEGGELTPTLKVRNKIILQKYGHIVEAMYSGKDYVGVDPDDPGVIDGSVQESALDGGSVAQPTSGRVTHLIGAVPTETAAATASEAEIQAGKSGTTAAHEKRPRWGRRLLFLGVVVILLLLVTNVLTAVGGIRIPNSINVLGMIQKIHSNTDQLNKVNSKILGNMNDIKNRAGATSQISAGLTSLKSGAAGTNSQLQTLQGLSVKEVQLSQSFTVLASSLSADLKDIGNESSAQNNTLSRMKNALNNISATANQMVQTNQTASQKLSTAAAKAGEISAEMP